MLLQIDNATSKREEVTAAFSSTSNREVSTPDQFEKAPIAHQSSSTSTDVPNDASTTNLGLASEATSSSTETRIADTSMIDGMLPAETQLTRSQYTESSSLPSSLGLETSDANDVIKSEPVSEPTGKTSQTEIDVKLPSLDVGFNSKPSSEISRKILPSQPEVSRETIPGLANIIKTEPSSEPNIKDEPSSERTGNVSLIPSEDVSMLDASSSTSVAPGSDSQVLIKAEEAQPLRDDGTFMAFDRDFLEMARANRGDLEAEFAEDSDPEVSDDSADSDDTSSDDDSEDDSDYGSVILDPAEAARMLMRASPDEDGGSSAAPRTANEQMEKPQEIPDILNIAQLKITELGHVSHIITQINCIVIRATIHSNHNVLQPGSALCLENRTLIRPIADTIAQVQEPYYISYFSSPAEISDFGIEEGSKIYYVDHEAHRAFVFYEDLRREKGTDASNINDEEVDEKEIEFSDDEAEAAYKKMKKEEKLSRRNKQEDDDEVAQPQHGRRGRGGRGGPRDRGARSHRGGRGGWQDFDGGANMGEASYAPKPPPQPTDALDYGDDGNGGGDADGYTPLKRPDNYGTAAFQNAPPPLEQLRPTSSSSHDQDQGHTSYNNHHNQGGYNQHQSHGGYNSSPRDQRGNFRGRSRGNHRGQHRGGRGGGHFTNNSNQNQNDGTQGSWQQNMGMPVPPPPMMNFQSGTSVIPPPPPPNWAPNSNQGSMFNGIFQPQQNQGNAQYSYGGGLPQNSGSPTMPHFGGGMMPNGGFPSFNGVPLPRPGWNGPGFQQQPNNGGGGFNNEWQQNNNQNRGGYGYGGNNQGN
jgi:H/ACA ribonucleoprotein complex non-core subunit NAF1